MTRIARALRRWWVRKTLRARTDGSLVELQERRLPMGRWKTLKSWS
jgi:hypothetical protein